jgi:hypothetical protein
MMKKLLPFFALWLSGAAPASAETVTGFSCTPEEFTFIGSDGIYHLQGRLVTPTPGYIYEINDLRGSEDGEVRATMTLSLPPGATLQEMNAVDIVYAFPWPESPLRFVVDIDKTFSLGVDEIVCSTAK